MLNEFGRKEIHHKDRCHHRQNQEHQPQHDIVADIDFTDRFKKRNEQTESSCPI
jgi:hypothetical protein